MEWISPPCVADHPGGISFSEGTPTSWNVGCKGGFQDQTDVHHRLPEQISLTEHVFASQTLPCSIAMFGISPRWAAKRACWSCADGMGGAVHCRERCSM